MFSSTTLNNHPAPPPASATMKPATLKNLMRSYSNHDTFRKPFFSTARVYCTTTTKPVAAPIVVASKNNNLFSRISPLKHADQIVPLLDQWVEEGRKVKYLELQRIIRDLRSRRRHSQALQVSEWMCNSGLCTFTLADRAVQLDLIGVVRGWEAAERFFYEKLSEEERNAKTYGAMLNCYVRVGLVEKSLSHVERMKEMGYVSCSLVYNNIMGLYKNTSQLEKIPDVLLEMKENGVVPNNFSYRICISSYGERSDLDAMEKVIEEMENQPHISMDWTTYSIVANFYIKANVEEKAVVFLKKLEEKLHNDALGYNHLISLYAQLGDKEEMTRLWNVQKIVCKKHINRDYITMLGSLVKIGDLETAEAVLKEWESSCHTYDFRVPNILLIGYCQKGFIEKAEALLHIIIEKGKKPTPNSWGIIGAGYMDKGNMEKAFKCLKEALGALKQNPKWRPKPELLSGVLAWLGERGQPETVKAFFNSLKTVAPANRDMYHALIKAYVRDGREVEWILESMKVDKVEKNEETEKILSLR